jgi:ASC-1-like (ASCH) protein
MKNYIVKYSINEGKPKTIEIRVRDDKDLIYKIGDKICDIEKLPQFTLRILEIKEKRSKK